MSAEALDLAARTAPLAGRTPRCVDGRVIAAIACVAPLSVLAPMVFDEVAVWRVVAAIAIVVAMLAGVSRWLTRAVALNNTAVAALANERWREADEAFAALATGRFPRSYAVLGLHNLASSALQRGALDEAHALAEAALTMGRALRGRSAEVVPLVVALAARLRAAKGDTDQARALIERDTSAPWLAQVEAHRVLTRMYVAYKQGRHDDVLAEARANRALLFDVLVGVHAAIAEVIEALAARHLSGAYRAESGRLAMLPISRTQHTTLLALLPEAAPLVVVDEA